MIFSVCALIPMILILLGVSLIVGFVGYEIAKDWGDTLYRKRPR